MQVKRGNLESRARAKSGRSDDGSSMTFIDWRGKTKISQSRRKSSVCGLECLKALTELNQRLITNTQCGSSTPQYCSLSSSSQCESMAGTSIASAGRCSCDESSARRDQQRLHSTIVDGAVTARSTACSKSTTTAPLSRARSRNLKW